MSLIASCFFNQPATTEIYTLSLHDALPIFNGLTLELVSAAVDSDGDGLWDAWEMENFGDRKSTRLNSSHSSISYAVFCLKKKKNRPRSSAYSCPDRRQRQANMPWSQTGEDA